MNTSITFTQQEFEKTTSTPTLSPQYEFFNKSFIDPYTNSLTDMHMYIEKSQELCNSLNMFCEQYKSQENQLKSLEERLKQKQKRQGFNKKHETPVIEEFLPEKSIYQFTPIVIYR